jgi:hypothetical protein
MAEDPNAAPAESGDRRGAVDDDPSLERHYALQRALADGLQLAELQVEILQRLTAADHDGDEAAIQRYHAELGHIMSRVADVERVRTGTDPTQSEMGHVACASCGSLAEPTYETPRLLGYRCPCGWTATDPAAQTTAKNVQAKEAAILLIDRILPTLQATQVTLGRRGKKAHQDGLSTLRRVHDELTAASNRIHATQPPR